MLRISREMRCLLAAALLVGLLPLTATARPAVNSAPIEQALLDSLNANGRAGFFVKMAVEADLSAAPEIRDWGARGWYVWNALGEVARSTQAPVLEYARERGLDATSLVAGNAVYIRDGDLAAAEGLAAQPGVAYLRLERVLPLDPASPEQLKPATEAEYAWGILDTHAPEVWALGVRGAGVRVAGIDTGVQWDHPALINQYGCPDDPGNPACWWDPSNVCGGVPCDNNGHGTHTMGTMVAKDDPTFPYIVGMAPDATWIACKGCESSACSDFALISCAEWALAPGGDPANRPQVVNNSWGGAGCDDWYEPWVTAWWFSGIVPVFAPGGSGPSCASIGSPGDYQDTFAPTAYDETRNISGFAARGPSCYGHDPYTKPNISAPGTNVCSTLPGNGWTCGYSGTSMSTAYGSGAMALVLSACPNLVGNVPASFEALQDNADTPPPGNCGAPPDGEGNYTYGYGYVNVLAAVEACSDTLHVAGIKLRYLDRGGGRYVLTARVRIVDQDNLPVQGALVEGEWTLPDGSLAAGSGVTDARGFVQVRLKSRQTGEYQFCVTNVGLSAYTYDPDQNVETCDTLALP